MRLQPRSDGTVFKLTTLPKEGQEKVFSSAADNTQLALDTGDYIYHQEEKAYYVATDAATIDSNEAFEALLAENKMLKVPAEVRTPRHRVGFKQNIPIRRYCPV